MPTYLYRCPQCNESHEELRSIDERRKNLPICNACDIEMGLAIVAPTLIGFDTLGRSKKNKEETKDKNQEIKEDKKKPEKQEIKQEKKKTEKND